jgi:hypothetical protein
MTRREVTGGLPSEGRPRGPGAAAPGPARATCPGGGRRGRGRVGHTIFALVRVLNFAISAWNPCGVGKV